MYLKYCEDKIQVSYLMTVIYTAVMGMCTVTLAHHFDGHYSASQGFGHCAKLREGCSELG